MRGPLQVLIQGRGSDDTLLFGRRQREVGLLYVSLLGVLFLGGVSIMVDVGC